MLDQLHERVQQLLQNTSFWTICSATIGGVYQTIDKQPIMLNTVSLDGSLSVMIYAFLSASVGYCTKKGFDYLFQKIKKK